MRFSFADEQEFRIYLLLAFTRDELKKIRSKELLPSNIRPEQARILAAIKKLGADATPTTIGEIVPRDSQTICGMLNRLEKVGLVNRVKESKNAKKTRIVLTPAGEDAVERSAHHEKISQLFEVLTSEEKNLLEAYLEKLYQAASEFNKGT